MLVGSNADLFTMTTGDLLDYTTSVMLTNKMSGFSFKVISVYGSPYEDGKQAFLDELHKVLGSWQGPLILGGDFNMVRAISDKSNGIVNFKWMDLFNEWIDRWGLLELNPKNRKFTWTNNQDNVIMAKIDRILVSIAWDAAFPMARVKALERLPSDHNPLLVDFGDNIFFGKKHFGFEKWWLEEASFGDIVQKVWNHPCDVKNSMDR